MFADCLLILQANKTEKNSPYLCIKDGHLDKSGPNLFLIKKTENISCQLSEFHISYHHFTYQLPLLIMGKKLSKGRKNSKGNPSIEEKSKSVPKPEPGTEPTDDDLEAATAEAAKVLDHVTKSRPQV